MSILSSSFGTAGQSADLSGAILIEMTKGSEVFTCSGVAISDQVILTSAHCMDDNATNVKVILGGDYQKNKSNFIAVDYYLKHEEYNQNKSLFLNDIAIVFLKEKLPKKIKPLKIGAPGNNDDFVRVGFGGRKSKNIRNTIAVKRVLKNQIINYLIFSDSNSVIGDSGGPILKIKGTEAKLVGLHSTAESGGSSYAVKLDYYKKWIDQKIKTHKQINKK